MLVVDRLIGLASAPAALRRGVRLGERGKTSEAFPLLTRAARAGIAEAEYRVARSYLQGSGVPASRVEGARWLERAARQGYVEAQSLLAALCVHGLANGKSSGQADRLFAADEPTEPDFEVALKWAQEAAEAGSAQGQAMLAYVLTCGPEPMRDLEAAHHWYERSAAAGCPEGCLGYALSLAPRTNDEEGRRLVALQLRRAAEAELPTAIYLLGVLTEQGVGVARDTGVAVQLYRHAAGRGQRSAQLRWGLMLIEGRHVDQDIVEGESWLRRAALAGDAEAAALVGGLYVKNGRLPPNYTEAAGWYRRAAEMGHSAAARALGSLYLTGAGVAQDSEEAARWLRISGRRATGLRRWTSPICCWRGRAIRKTRQGWHDGSRRRPLQAISLPPSISGSASIGGSVSSAMSSRRRTGYAAPPKACQKLNTCMAGCSLMGAGLLRIWKARVPGSHGPPRQACGTPRLRSPR
jgi:uncharacterized protein